MIGRTISHYTILEKIGEGGMGVVFKARDTRLDREVALKFLPHDYTISDEERKRFVHEAKSASALDHPNICTIYEIDETDDGQMFIAMGYYQGVSLSNTLEKGRLQISEAIKVAIQIAEGLQAAHESGIVHRDIKSSNIIITDKGQVKILDFGLAQKSGMTKLTKTGSTLGTASYMSPEQARGEAIDHRSDLWSLGVVIYEMVTGKLPFSGDHEPAILYSVVNKEPEPIGSLLPEASAELVHIIGRTLEKDPAERYKSAEDMLIDLRRLRKETTKTGYEPVGITRRKTKIRIVFLAVAVALLAAVILYKVIVPSPVAINLQYVQHTVDVPYDQSLRATISPNGQWIVFAAADKSNFMDLYVVPTTGDVPRRITYDSASVEEYQQLGKPLLDPKVSPDDNQILYTRIGHGGVPGIFSVPLVGGQVKKIGEGLFPRWSPDGKRVGYIVYPQFSADGRAEFWTMRPDGSQSQHCFTDTIGTAEKSRYWFVPYHFDWSPDGNSIVWVRRTPQFSCDILVHDIRNGSEYKVVEGTTLIRSVCWLPNGVIVYDALGSDGIHLWMIPQDGGTPIQITRGKGMEAYPSTTRDGSKLLFTSATGSNDLWIGSMDGSEPKKVATIAGEIWDTPDYSPSRGQIVFPKAFLGATNYNLAVIDQDGANERWLTRMDNYFAIDPMWSPNGNLICYKGRNAFNPNESQSLYVLDPKTLEAPRKVLGPATMYGYWITDSVLGAHHSLQGFRAGRSMRIRIDGGQPERMSADSLWVLFVNDKQHVIYTDLRRGDDRGIDPTDWIVPIEDWHENGGTNPRPFKRNVPDGCIGSYGRGRARFEIWCDPLKGDLWKVWYPDARKELILHASDALKGAQIINLTWDETGYTYISKPVITSSIIMIEDLFQKPRN